MQMVQAVEDLPQGGDGLFLIHGLRAVLEVGQVPAVAELHDDIKVVGSLDEIVYLYQVRAVHLALQLLELPEGLDLGRFSLQFILISLFS